MAFFIIKDDFDMTDYPGVVYTNWDMIPAPAVAQVKSEISGDTVKFHALDPDVSAPVASELEIAETEITAPEKPSVDAAIVVRVTKTEVEGNASYSVEYWIAR